MAPDSIRMIGILAGMGPKSTGPFIEEVVSTFQKTTGAIDDIDFPPMMIYSLPTPFYIDRPLDHALLEKTISNGLQKLESCGASFIAMPCNTAHVYFEKLQKSIRIPLLNMIEETLKQVPQTAKKASLFGTRTTLEAGLYQTGLRQAGIEFLFEPVWQGVIDRILRQIKSSSELPLDLWQELHQNAMAAGIDTLLIACTDLNPLLAVDRPACRIVDASECLAQAIVEKWLIT